MARSIMSQSDYTGSIMYSSSIMFRKDGCKLEAVQRRGARMESGLKTKLYKSQGS